MAERYDPQEAEPRLRRFWQDKGIYHFDEKSEKEIFSIDTPPPTVSGRMHMGHACSYAQTDFIARYQRMRGKEVFYPFGTDDNGLPTQILIQKLKNVRAQRLGRKEFTKLCLDTLKEELRPEYLEDWKRIAISCDWSYSYSTIDPHSIRISQRSFLDLVKKDHAYRKEAPAMVCPQCKTAIAQVELEDKQRQSVLYHVKVPVEGGESVTFATSRPELMMACIAISVHPDDERYKKLVGKTATIPASGAKVPIIADEMTKMDFGSGVVYWCPFGDSNDIEFVQKHPELEVKHIMGPDGRLNEQAGKYAGMRSEDARKAVVGDWEREGAIVDKESITQIVNVHERCGQPIEFVVMTQWFIRVKDHKERWLELGEKLDWYPQFMKHRYDNWAKGLKWDWNISRQIFFGVPFPVWYSKKTGEPIFADESQLPVYPSEDLPKTLPAGHTKEDIVPETDIMNTWATSSLTPQIAIGLVEDEQMRQKLYPMSMRPQGHDIISFWLFNTVVKAYYHTDELPWRNACISGWILDPKGKKMSKSKGNAIAPQGMMEKYSADALRFFAASSKLGEDMPFQEKELTAGHKTVNKLWNAARFAAMHFEDLKSTKRPTHIERTDRWLLSRLQRLIKDCTDSFEEFSFFKTKSETENFFWNVFCDFYLEIVKDRLYNPDTRGEEARTSAQYTLYVGLLTVLKLFAPILPHITEEIYQKYFREREGAVSIHRSSWPTVDEKLVDDEAERAGELVVYAVTKARQAKSEAKVSLKTPLKKLFLKAPISQEEFLDIEADIKGATGAEKLIFETMEEGTALDFVSEVEL